MSRIVKVPSLLHTSLFDTVRYCIDQDGVIAVGTESFYALAASAMATEAVHRVVKIKGRPPDKPILTLIANLTQLSYLVDSFPKWASSLFENFWPGPLTIVFPARPYLSSWLTGGTGTIGVRIPGNEFLTALLEHTGPLTGTSANRSGRPSPLTAQQVEDEIGPQLDMILDNGSTPGGLPSTILSLVDIPHILREGQISRHDIENLLAAEGINLGN